ncbi:GNAT family N-acetyltransferase [Streptomyces sp. R21]|uniref:Lysine N-acyltransferase MbtK n=1 Tax=Streptomyces sp. R21 TaxID=3238627 RepID=A0AB39P572_9ACTN
MSPTDASTDAGTAPATDLGTDTGLGPGTDCEETLDLRLPDELIALFAEAEEAGADAEGVGEQGALTGAADSFQFTRDSPQLTTDSVPLTPTDAQLAPADAPLTPAAPLTPTGDPAASGGGDLLDSVGDWGPTATPVGVFRLVPVRIGRDLPLIARWMNDPAVAAFWELAGPESVVEEHLCGQLDGDGRSVPCLGVLDGTPMSYWEIYRADLDLLARHYPARPHDTGIHLLIGGVADRGRGLGSALLRAVADLVLDKRPTCARVVAEPDLRNTPSVSAFLSAGFRFSTEVDLPDKKAALMVRDRALRDLL